MNSLIDLYEGEEDTLFQNENYVVLLIEDVDIDRALDHNGSIYHSFYELVNRRTGVTEARGLALPQILMAAEQYSLALENEEYKFFRDAQEEELGEEPLAGEDAPVIN